MKLPAPDRLRLAADWLESYEAEPSGEETENDMKAVATWLRAKADEAERHAVENEAIKTFAEEHRVSPAAVRKALAVRRKGIR